MALILRIIFLAGLLLPLWAAAPVTFPETPHEKQLIQRIQAIYQKIGRSGRPLIYHNDTFRLEFTLSLVKIIDLNEDAQTLTSVIWSRHKWRDPFIAWDPRDYKGIKTVRVPVNSIWKPDFILYNNLNDQTTERDMDEAIAMAWIHSDGTIIWIPPNVYKSQCDDQFDSTNFPYDEPQCSFKFGSWAWEAKMFDPTFSDDKADISLVPFIPSSRWQLADHWANKNMAYYSCCPDAPFADLTYTIKLRRGNVQFYRRMMLWPNVLLTALTVAPFLLPTQSKSKVFLAGSVFVAFFLYSFVLVDMVGSAAKNASRGAPKIVTCFCISIMLSAISVFLSALLKDMYDWSHKVPRIVKKIFIDILAPVFFCRALRNALRRHQAAAALKADAAADAGGAGETAFIVNSGQPAPPQEPLPPVDDEPLKSRRSSSASKCCSGLGEWQIVAIVLNRLFLVVFAIATVLTLSIFLPKPSVY